MRVSKKTYPSQFDAIVESLTPRRLTTWLGLFLLLGISIYILFEAGKGVKERLIVNSWVEVHGTITSIENTSASGRAIINFSYKYNDVFHNSTRIGPSLLKSTKLTPRERNKLNYIIDQNHSISIMVNPNNPEESFYDMRSYEIYIMLFILIKFTLGVLLYFYVIFHFFSRTFIKDRD